MNRDRDLLIACKLIVNDMELLHAAGVGPGGQELSPLYMGMGHALMRVYSVMIRRKPEEVKKMKPLDIIKWVKEQKVSGEGQSDMPAGLIKVVTQ